MTRAQSRKHRGYATQRLLAERWRANGIAPYAKAVGAGEAGNDLLDVPGLAVEIKARDTVSLPAALRQASKCMGTCTRGVPDVNCQCVDNLPICVWRHNGQGEVSIGEWTVSMSLTSFEKLWSRTRSKS